MHSLKELPDTEGGYVAWVACEQALLRVWVRCLLANPDPSDDPPNPDPNSDPNPHPNQAVMGPLPLTLPLPLTRP
eukprot:scaffold10398_cov50-Phaeocystis_antarctica.AAC.2